MNAAYNIYVLPCLTEGFVSFGKSQIYVLMNKMDLERIEHVLTACIVYIQWLGPEFLQAAQKTFDFVNRDVLVLKRLNVGVDGKFF